MNTSNLIYSPQWGNLIIAEAYAKAGLNIIPIKTDGTKQPAIPAWRQYHSTPMPRYLVGRYWGSIGLPRGIAILGGLTSGGLEILDFDLAGIAFRPWAMDVSRLIPGLLPRLPIVRTPSNGYHVFFRSERAEGNQKLALDENAHTLIETRGQGGYVVAPGSPPSTHRTGKPYTLLSGDLLGIPFVSSDERRTMLEVARRFNRIPEDETIKKPKERVRQASPVGKALEDRREGEDRPGDWLNSHATWESILEPHGWQRIGKRGTLIYWARPDKDTEGHSATTGFRADRGHDLLYVFSSNAHPFEAGRWYSKFHAYALLNAKGDFQQAALAIRNTLLRKVLTYE